MKYLTALLMLITSSAWAGWTYITSAEGDAISAGGNLEHFLDYETLRKEGNLRRIWMLINFPPNDKEGWGSVRIRVEFDCKNETSKRMSYTVFSGKLSTGKIIFTQDKESPKEDIPPDTATWTIFKDVCKR